MSTEIEGPKTPSRREANMAATRAALLATARRHFAENGFGGADLARIAGDAAVTTGAIYHHFGSKKGLFEAVAEQMEAEIVAAGVSVTAEGNWARLQAGFERLIDVCADPDIQRIVFVEAPQVMGPEAWREMELRYAYGAMRGGLSELMAEGVLRAAPVDLVARTLLVVLGEAAAEVARSPGNAVVREQVARLMAGVLNSLLAA